MITKSCLTTEWITTASEKNNKADRILVEKVIRALRLLEGLVESQLMFVFKGGTSLMLLLGSTKRLSIDIDIIMDKKVELDECFEKIAAGKGFKRFELQERSTTIHIKKSFSDFASDQLKDRNLGEEVNLVTDDIFDTALTICTRGKSGKAKFSELEQGIRKVNAFIFSENYHIEKAITDASKAAYLATIIKHNKSKVEKFSNALEVKDCNIEQPFDTRLNKLKKSNPEAFFYWYKIYEIENEKKS